MIAAPQIATATITPTPIRRTAGTQPENTAPSSAPTAGAAAIRPSPAGPTLNTSSASAGNSEVGMPKIIALRSMTNVERITRRARTKLRPSRIADSPGRVTAPSGGSGAIAAIPASDAVNVSTSAR